MIRMTLLSFFGHTVAALGLLFLSWYQPIPKVKRGVVQTVRFPRGSGVLQPGGGGSPPGSAKKTPQTVSITPLPSTPAPPKPTEMKKTIARQAKKSLTPEPTKSPTPSKKQTATPKATPTAKPSPTPEKTKAGTPGKTPSATPSKSPTAGAATTPKPGLTPGAGEAKTAPAPIVIGGGTKPGTGPTGPGIPGVPGGTGTEPLSEFDYYKYMAIAKVERNFNVPRHLRAEGLSCLIRLTVLRDGRITHIRILQGTSDPILDGLALRALEATEQFGPLPDTLKEDQVEMDFQFDYSASESTELP